MTVVFISSVQQSDSDIYIYITFHILSHYGLSQDIEYSYMCNTIDLLYIHFMYNYLHLLILDSQSILPSPPPP